MRSVLRILATSCAAFVLAGAAFAAVTNPFFQKSPLPYQAPPFDKIQDADYQPAIEEGMQRQLAEIDAIANDPAPPTFANTIVAIERTGELLTRVDEGVLHPRAGEHERHAAEAAAPRRRRSSPRTRTRST